MNLKRWAKQRFLQVLANRLPWHGRIAYSQFGEDIAAHTLHLPGMTLSTILERYVPPGREIDLLCTDCEGADPALLQSLDWSRYTPKVVVFEDEAAPATSATVQLLARHGYQVFARLGPS